MVFTWITYFALFYAASFLIVHIIILAGIFISFAREKKINSSGISSISSKVSVIVPARDEEETLPFLLESLDKQSYQDFNVVLINDRSSDNTLNIMNTYMEENLKTGKRKVTVINNKESFEGKNPKQMALSLADDATKGDSSDTVFLYTDADCIVPEKWVEYMASPFKDRSVGVVFGTVSIEPKNWSKNSSLSRYLLENFQQFDHFLRYYYTAAAAGLNNPSGGFGNNLAIRGDALSEIGGFGNLEYSATEDAQLIAKVRNCKKWKIFAHTAKEVKVITAPEKTWKELCLQELRWSAGAMHAPDFNATIGYGFMSYQLLTGILFLIPAFFNPLLFCIFFTGTVGLFAVSTVAAIHLKAGKSFWKTYIISILIAQFIFPIVTLKATLNPGVVWKGNRLERKKR